MASERRPLVSERLVWFSESMAGASASLAGVKGMVKACGVVRFSGEVRGWLEPLRTWPCKLGLALLISWLRPLISWLRPLEHG